MRNGCRAAHSRRCPLSAIATISGNYQLRIQTVSPPQIKGNYQLKVEVKGAATDTDKKRVQAERLMRQHRDEPDPQRKLEQNGRSWELIIPSEAQFVYATRAGGKDKYFRNMQGQEVTEDKLSEYANFGQYLYTGSTISVKEKKPNAWGLHQCSSKATGQ